MRTLFGLAVALVGCGSSPNAAAPDAPLASVTDARAASIDAAPAATGFGELSGQCGVLTLADFASAAPELFRDTMTFAAEYVDATDRPRFAFEEPARCEHADLLHTETEIDYATPGKITDLEVSLMGHKLGVSVTRAFAYPLGQPYTVAAATTLIKRKLQDIQTSSADVSRRGQVGQADPRGPRVG